MTIKTTAVSRNLYVNYLKRAHECLSAAQRSLTNKEWNAAAISAIHSAIASIDALCVFYLGVRHTGERHEDVIRLLKTIKLKPEEIEANTKRIKRILSAKNMAEYEERLVFQSEANNSTKDAERLFAFVTSKVPRERA
jgi:HEPN domain-containing protein